MKNLVIYISAFVLITGSAFAAKAPGAFKRNDVEKDGLLNKEEYVAARIDGTQEWFEKEGPGMEAWHAKFPNPEKQFAKDFSKWDTNGDGSVDAEEWLNKGK